MLKEENAKFYLPPCIEIESLETGQPAVGMDFETKLKKLESLRQERLIDEEEYRRKRSEIMMEKW